MIPEIKNPLEQGYIMPPEWFLHNATWISWPHNKDTWQNNLDKVEQTYLIMINVLSQDERVNVLVNDKNTELRIRKILSSTKSNLNNLSFYIIKTSDVWIRDYGPNFVINKERKLIAMNSWQFNAWGEKYTELMNDNDIPERINTYLKIPIFKTGIVLEGGSIDVNGEGSCLTTEQCLLNKNRNPNLSKDGIESYLNNYLGISNVIWLKEGIIGDDTDGHIDDIARFVNKITVVCAFEDNQNDKNHKILKNNYETLCNSTYHHGKKFNIIKLPMPKPVESGNIRLPASYINFYIANKIVLVPIFNQENDKKAIRILERLFPSRNIIGIDCRDLVFGLGAIHCVTQQEPKV